LSGRAELNGRVVTLAGWVDDKQRWRCLLDDGGEVGVRPTNLIACENE
jgi:hypothetical protein